MYSTTRQTRQVKLINLDDSDDEIHIFNSYDKNKEKPMTSDEISFTGLVNDMLKSNFDINQIKKFITCDKYNISPDFWNKFDKLNNNSSNDSSDESIDDYID